MHEILIMLVLSQQVNIRLFNMIVTFYMKKWNLWIMNVPFKLSMMECIEHPLLFLLNYCNELLTVFNNQAQ